MLDREAPVSEVKAITVATVPVTIAVLVPRKGRAAITIALRITETPATVFLPHLEIRNNPPM